MKNLFLLLLTLSASFAQCGGSASHYLPAVVNGKGVLVNVTLMLENGSGDAYVSIYPRMGISTQESVRAAVSYAFSESGENRSACDVKVKAHLPDKTSGYLDGPSGGAALALMAISALEKKPMRQDAMITGTVDNRGKVGQVSGLYEKAKIARENGLEYFLTPPQTLYERILLRMLQGASGVKIFEVRNIIEAKAFLIDGKNLSAERKPPYVEEISGDIPLYSAAHPEFRNLAEEMISLFNSSVGKISPRIFEEEKLGGYFAQMESNERFLLENGYYFSAANDAFINYLDAETIANVEDLDVGKLVSRIESCISETDTVQMSDANLAWVGGQEVRNGWALKKLGEVKGVNTALMDEKYLAYHKAMYAYAWCRISGMLGRNAPKGGSTANESLLENLSAEYLEAADKAVSGGADDDVLWHLENAEQLHSQGLYAGAIIDSVFAIEMENASMIYDSEPEAALAELQSLAGERRRSLWGDVYASHASYLLWKKENATAYNLFRFAKGLDIAEEKMRMEIRRGRATQPESSDEPCIHIFGLALMAAGVAATYFLLLAKQKTKVNKKKVRGAMQ